MNSYLSTSAHGFNTSSIGSFAKRNEQAGGFTIERGDLVFVTVSVLGRQILSTSETGHASVGELIDSLRAKLAGQNGMLTISMRNRSQGTCARRVVRLNRASTGLLRAQMKGYAA